MNRDRDKEYSIQRYQDESKLIKQNDDINLTLSILKKLEALLPQIKRMVDHNGG